MIDADDPTAMFRIHRLCALPVPTAQNRDQRATQNRGRAELWRWILGGKNPGESTRSEDRRGGSSTQRPV